MSNSVITKIGPYSLLTKDKKEDTNSTKYQTREELEGALISTLLDIGYEYRPDLNNEKALIDNLRIQLENLNAQRIKDFKFSNQEWDDFLSRYITGSSNWGIENRNKRIQGDGYQVELHRADGQFENIRFIDKQNPNNNFLQVINNYHDGIGTRKNEVTILMNGLPMVQIELKKRGMSLKEAFIQQDSRSNDSLHSSYRLFEFIQVFVITNGINSKYYSNTIKQSKQDRSKANDSFLFTSYWTDFENRKIEELEEFARNFLLPSTIKKIIAKYCVFDSERKLKVLRPYQISAIEKIKEKVEITISHALSGKDAGGYIWHTTGSGKTLTSFKVAQLALEIPEVQKVLFVVDRKDLDHQTCKEYENYSKGSVDGTKNSSDLETKLLDPIKSKKIIVTTIQKLSRLFGIDGRLKNKYFDEKIVIIIDECHRSQAGKMHESIIQHFRNANIFGFTGTPIMRDEEEGPANTSEIFGQCLHSYKICDAIIDANVLPFHYEWDGNWTWQDYIETPDTIQKQIRARIVNWILNNFKDKTCGGKFNSMFATRSIKDATEYHKLFEELQKNREEKLKVAVIYSSGSDSKPEGQDIEDGGSKDPLEMEDLSDKEKTYLEKAVEQYGKMFNSQIELKLGLQNYHTDVSERMKKKEIDILIVVNMFLTGFNAPKLNTLWLHKKLTEHNLIQALSRTNRILDDSKPFGNIVSFLNIKDQLQHAIAKFAGEEKLVIIPDFEEIYPDYKKCCDELKAQFPISEEGQNIWSEEDESNFCKLFSKLLELENKLRHFDQFRDSERLDEESVQDYKSKYLEILDKVKSQREQDLDAPSPFDGVNFEMEILDSQVVNIDFILKLLSKISETDDPAEKARLKKSIMRIVRADLSWRKIDDLFEEYLDKDDKPDGWFEYLKSKKEEEFQNIIAEEHLDEDKANAFMEDNLTNGEEAINWDGPSLRKMMPPMSHKLGKEEINKRKNAVRDRLERFYSRFNGRGI